MLSPYILEVEDLSVSFRQHGSWQQVLQGVSLKVRKGRILGVVGESGSGKTVASLACMGLLPQNISRIDTGEALFKGEFSLLKEGFKEAIHLRGSAITMVFQEPMSSLNPSMRVGEQVAESLRLHLGMSASAARARCIELFREVELPNPQALLRRYPHELSGGQKQRVMIAMALAPEPELLIADEPTTALDVTVQASIIRLLRKIQSERSLSMIFISHDLELVARIADDLAVMWKGSVVEQGSADAIFGQPSHPYTRGLLACKPQPKGQRIALPTVADALEGKPLPTRVFASPEGKKRILEVSDLKKSFPTRRNLFGKVTDAFPALRGVSFSVFEGETLGIVGESGCGKSTLSRILAGLTAADSGQVEWRIPGEKRKQPLVQLVFQDPFASLNPRMTALDCLVEALRVSDPSHSLASARQGAKKMIEEVGLPAGCGDNYPHAFSGGQRQRLVVARALCADPKVLLLDESVAALDISVQAQVLNLLNRLKEERKLTYLFVSHDLSVVAYMSDRVMVMREGLIEELAETSELLRAPKSAYAKQLLKAVLTEA